MLLDVSGINFEHADAHGQPKPPRSCAAGIKKEHTILLFDFRMMTVAVNHYANSGGFGFQVELPEVVDQIDRETLDFNQRGFGQRQRPWATIDVAAHHSHGREFS